MGKKNRKKLSDEYRKNSMIIHRPVNDAFPRVEVTRPGVVGVCDDNYMEILEPLPLYVGSDTANKVVNAKTIKIMADLAQELDMTLFYRPTLGLIEDNKAHLADDDGLHYLQRIARRSRERVMKWKGRTHGSVTHISTANREED